jgi:hypothetical protein
MAGWRLFYTRIQTTNATLAPNSESAMPSRTTRNGWQLHPPHKGTPRAEVQKHIAIPSRSAGNGWHTCPPHYSTASARLQAESQVAQNRWQPGPVASCYVVVAEGP